MEAQSLAEERLTADALPGGSGQCDEEIGQREGRKCKVRLEKLICKLLPVLDSLEQAAKHDEGARCFISSSSTILQAEGLVPIEAIGKKIRSLHA